MIDYGLLASRKKREREKFLDDQKSRLMCVCSRTGWIINEDDVLTLRDAWILWMSRWIITLESWHENLRVNSRRENEQNGDHGSIENGAKGVVWRWWNIYHLLLQLVYVIETAHTALRADLRFASCFLREVNWEPRAWNTRVVNVYWQTYWRLLYFNHKAFHGY